MAKKKTTKKTTTTSEQETKNNTTTKKPEFSVESVKQFYHDNKTVINKTFVILLLLIPIALAIYMRSFTADLPITDEWAEQSVAAHYQQQIEQQVRTEFPNLPPQQIQVRVQEEWHDLRTQNQEQIDAQIAATSQQFKASMQNDLGETYWPGIDTWTWLTETQNVLDHGYAGTELRDGVSYDHRAVAPIGQERPTDWHSYLIIFVASIYWLFNSSASLLGAGYWTPAIIAALATIPAFFITRRKAGNLGGFVAATLVAVHTAYMSRAPGGFVDTDGYHILFPLLIIWAFLEAFYAKEYWKKIALASLSGLLLGVYSNFWLGWWHALLIVLVTIIGYLGYVIAQYLYQKFFGTEKVPSWFKSETWTNVKATLTLTGAFYGTGLLFAGLFGRGFNDFFTAVLEPFGFAEHVTGTVRAELWPNVLTTVAELSDIAFSGVVGSMGGKLLFWFMLMGAVFALLPDTLRGKDYGYLIIATLMTLFLISDFALGFEPIMYLALLFVPMALGAFFLLSEQRTVDIKFGILLVVWIISMMYVTTQGTRFTLMLVAPLALAVGTFVGILWQHVVRISENELDIPQKFSMPILAIILCFVVLMPQITAAHEIGQNATPMMNDAWYDTLVDVREGTSEDAIITSWWDFGHWFRAVADRGVTFDGRTQGNPAAHWVGKLLLTEDEEESIGILRMLHCGSWTGFDRVNEELNDNLRTKQLMDEIVNLNRGDAREALQEQGFDETTIDEILALTHCDLEDGIVITSEDMVNKGAVWGHFGGWNFTRAYAYQNRGQPVDTVVNHLVERDLDSETADRITREARQDFRTQQDISAWISSWPSFAGGAQGCQVETGQINRTELGMNETANEGLMDRELAVCSSTIRIGETQGGELYLTGIIIDLEDPQNTRLRYGVVQQGQLVEELDGGQPDVLYTGFENQTGMTRYDFTGETAGLGVSYDGVNNRVVISDKEHAGSVFTQLFFFDGEYNERFEQFSDRTSFTGQRITTWKINW